MPAAIHRWPFLPSEARSIEDSARWWEECYVASRADRVAQGQAHWRILVGGPGSGKSTALAALGRFEAQDSLLLHYPSARWPGSPHAFSADGNHLAQIMALSWEALRETIESNLDCLDGLSESRQGFLRWLIQKFHGPRAFVRWVDGLDAGRASQLRKVPFDDLYPTSTRVLDVKGQIEELISLCRYLEYRRLFVLMDVEPTLSDKQIQSLATLFEWLELMHHPGLALAAAVPFSIVEREDLVVCARGRVSVVKLAWQPSEVREIADRHVRAATGSALGGLSDLAVPAVLDALAEEFEEQFGGPTPGGWTRLAEILLEFAAGSQGPVQHERLAEVRLAFYARFMPLHLDLTPVRRGVWRGPKFIPLEEQPFNFFELLWRRRGSGPVTAEALRGVAGSARNVHTLAHRVRAAIEPDPKEPIYLLNLRNEGYWIKSVSSSVDVRDLGAS